MLLSKKPKTAKTAISTQKIVHISRARRPFDTVAKIEPLQVVNDLWADVAKSRLPILVESSIRADLDRGDHAKLVLRKVNYVLTKIDEAFGMDPRTQLSKTEMINRMIRIIRDYGHPNGIPLLKTALAKSRNNSSVRQSVSVTVARIGSEEDLPLLGAQLLAEPNNYLHLESLEHFADRFPELADDVAKTIRINSKSTQAKRFALMISDISKPND